MVYYLYNDEDLQLIGIDKTTCSALKMNFLDGKINDITFLVAPIGEVYPEEELLENDRTLKGFTWRKEERPNTIIDLFDENDENKGEVIPNTKFSNPLKNIYFKYIKRQDPYSIESVNNLLSKFKDNVHLIKGNSNVVLKKIDMSKIDFVFLDGGHAYDTVKNDLNCCLEVINSNGTVLCDDYNLAAQAPEVKIAIDEFVQKNNFKCEILCDDRFAKIEKN